MSKKFTVHQESINKGEWYAYPSSIKYGDEVSIRNVPRGIAIKVAELLNIQESTITHLEEEKVELMEDCACQYREIQKLESENEDLREVNKENQRLHEENVKQCERWKNLYELKDKEVTARVDGLNKVCEYYTSEVLFKSDVDPNKAVKEVINEILNTEVEM